MRRVAPALAALLLLPSLAACRDGSGFGPRLVAKGGVVQLRRDGDTKVVRGVLALRPEDGVKVTDGTVVIRLGEGRQLELRAGSELTLAADGDDSAARLVAGDVLVIAPAQPVTVESEGTAADVHGSARMSHRLAVVVAAYTGFVDLASGTRTLRVPALRQASVALAGLLPRSPDPLAYSPSDSWDQRLLGDAIELGGQLSARSRGFTAQLQPGEGRSADFFRGLLPGLEAQTDLDASRLGDPSRPPGETLVGLGVALEGNRGTFRERWASVVVFRDAGAEWGLVALDQGVARGPLLERIDAAIRRGPSRFGAGGDAGAGGSVGGGTGGSGSRGTAGTPGATGGTGTTPGSSSGSGTVSAPGGQPAMPAGDAGDGGATARTGIPLVDNLVNDLVEALSGLLRSLGP